MNETFNLITLILFYACLLASVTMNFLHYMHMFQLNSYHAGEQLKWAGTNIKNVILRHLFPVIGAVYAVVMLFVTKGIVGSDHLFASGMMLIGLAFAMPKKAKKKLVFTPRVIRMCVTSTLVYALGCVLFCIFLYESGWYLFALCLWQLISFLLPLIANLINKPIEHGVNRHYINDAKRIINELPNLTVVGLTGSYGKTSTKFYLEKLLGAKYRVLMTPESYNTTMGVVKVVRGSLNATHEIFLCEMGAKNVGEIKEICDIVKPHHGIITSIGPQHLESFKSIENIIKTKFELADALPSDGMIFLNYDNEYISGNSCDKKKITYGLEGMRDFYATDISVSEKGTTFTIHANGETREFSTRLIGSNNVQNIVGAIAVANTLGVPLSDLVMPVKRLECVPHRLQIINRGGTVIIDDAFNSNPTGAKAALDTLAVFDGMKILVTPGMIELGEKEFELNERFGMQAAKVCDYIIAVGERQAVPIMSGLKKEGYPEDKQFVAKSLNEALAKVDSLRGVGRKKIVLLENDLPDNY